MKKRLQIITFFLFVYNYSFSQLNEKESIILKKHTVVIEKSYENCDGGDWSKKSTINNGLICKEENYLEKKLMSIQKYIYDENGNIIFQIMTYSISKGNINDTIFKYRYKYDDVKRVIEKEYTFGIVEKFSKFDENSKPKLIERYNKDGKTLYFWPIKEEREFDSLGNLIKEVKTKIDYPDDPTDTIKKINVETNIYKYDKFGYVVEIKRDNNPKENYPIYMVGGLPLYEIENFKYKYDKTGLWTKKYWIADGKTILLSKRIYQ